MGKSVKEIACQQVLQPDGSVFSVQWTVFPPAHREMLSGKFLLERYLDHVAASTFGGIRPTYSANSLEFRLFGRFPLLSFYLPEFLSKEGSSVVDLFIRGGALVQPGTGNPGRFSLSAEIVPEGIRVTSALADFRPRLLGPPPLRRPRIWLYRFTQAAIHKRTTVQYLAALWQGVTGGTVRTAVQEVTLREGKKI